MHDPLPDWQQNFVRSRFRKSLPMTEMRSEIEMHGFAGDRSALTIYDFPFPPVCACHAPPGV